MTERIKHILRGVGSVVVLAPTDSPAERVQRAAPHPSDAEAMYADWAQVGSDLRSAFESVARGEEEADKK